MGYSAAVAETAATAATAITPPRRTEETRIETPCFFGLGRQKPGCERRTPFHSKVLLIITNVNATHYQYWMESIIHRR
jgi:hypothetical protein